MKISKIKFFMVAFILLCCLVGAVSAADDIGQDAMAIDDVAIAEQAGDVDLQTDEANADVSSEQSVSTDSQQDISIEANNAKEENLRTSGTATVTNWTQLADKANSTGTDYTINLNGPINITSEDVVFGNNAIIVGNDNSYITGNANGRIPLKSNDTSLSITFRDVKFQNINCQMLIQLETSGISILDNCTFINITAGTGHDSVVYNNLGTMNMTNCTFINCTAGFGAVTNYMSGSTTGVTLNVKDSTFENNYGSTEPGAINNCGILTVYNSTFNNNSAYQWAGAIHTHSNANTVINKSSFKHNVAGWNGGALFTYSVLRVYDSIFEDNNCSTNNGGGAIGAYNYGSLFDIIINNCTFKYNNNLNSNGKGGAIGTLNGGYLNVYNSTFISNSATNGQAISAANKKVINGTSDRPYLAIDNNTFINHTGSGDTVYINGIINSFNNNHFYNSTQSTIYSGSGNTYNSLINPISMTKGLLGAFSNDILSDAIQREVTDDDSFEDAFTRMTKTGYGSEPQVVNILVSPGIYSKTIKPNLVWEVDEDYGFGYYRLDGAAKLFALGIFTVEGTGDNVIFRCADGYNLDLKGGIDTTEWDQEAIRDTISHKNIIFDCDVILGSRSYEFTNCTFKKALYINGYDINDYWNLYYDTDCDIVNIYSFKDCTFEFDKEEIAINKIIDSNIQFNENSFTLNFDNCKFPVTAVDSVVDISSSEKGVVVIALTDNSSAPIAGATVKYTVNGGEEQTNTTDADGKFTISGLTGEVTIEVNYEGNESFKPISDSKFFNFTEEPVVPAKVATKITAPKVSAVYNVAKNLLITLTANGKAIANKKVTVKVGTISKTLKTNAKGQVSLNVATLVPKTYTASVKFAGDDGYLASSVSTKVVVSKAKPKITAKAKTFKVKVKTKKYTVTLKNNKGKVMKKVKLTLKVGKKTYKATTNSKGKATFKITKLTKKGKYTATIKFAGSKYYKALSKKAKITVKK